MVISFSEVVRRFLSDRPEVRVREVVEEIQRVFPDMSYQNAYQRLARITQVQWVKRGVVRWCEEVPSEPTAAFAETSPESVESEV